MYPKLAEVFIASTVLEADTAYITRDDSTNDVVLSTRPGEKAWGNFFDLVRVMSWDAEAADWYAGIRYRLITTGQPIGEPDMMIAAHSLSVGPALVTNNVRHYKRPAFPPGIANLDILPSLKEGDSYGFTRRFA